MTDDIGYQALTEAAMRGVVREALKTVQANGTLPGNHHFYLTFRTRAPGVKIPAHLVERFPEDMTIVVQHQFWDLEVHEGHFEVILKFSGVPQHLSVPFAALTRFADPSVDFGLQLDTVFTAPDSDIVPPALPGEPGEQPRAVGDEAPGTVVSLDAFRRK